MIQALTCPSCQHTSTVAEDVSLQAVLRCPHCGNQIVLGEIVDHELDSWELIDDPGALVVATVPVASEAVFAGEATQDEVADEYIPELQLVNKEILQGEPQQVLPTPTNQTPTNQTPTNQTPANQTPAKQKFDWSKYDTSGYEPLRARTKTRSPM